MSKKKGQVVAQISDIEEREAHITLDYYTREITLYTNNSTIMNRLMRLGIEPIKEEYEDKKVYSRTYVLPFDKMNPLLGVTLYK